MRLILLTLFQALLLLAALIFAAPARSETRDGEVIEVSDFTSRHWTRGLHLNAGLGVNSTLLKNDYTHEDIGLGLNIHTDVGYYFLNDYALETSVNVMFNRVKTAIIWDTSMTFGLRARLPAYLGPDHSAPYLRLAAGRGPSVFFFQGEKPAELEARTNADRVQVEGDIYSIAYGFFQDARDGTVWYLELQQSTTIYRKIEGINEVNDVPEVVYSEHVSNHESMYSLSLTFGVLLF